MPSFTYTEEEVPQWELLKPGYYAFEVIGAEFGLGKGKTAGNDVVTTKLKLFALPPAVKSEPDWTKPVGTLTERLTMPLAPSNCIGKDARDLNSFFGGICNMFVKCTNMIAEVGQAIELTESTIVGLRGVAYIVENVIPEGGRKGEKVNRLKTWCTDKAKFDRNAPAEEEKPF